MDKPSPHSDFPYLDLTLMQDFGLKLGPDWDFKFRLGLVNNKSNHLHINNFIHEPLDTFIGASDTWLRLVFSSMMASPCGVILLNISSDPGWFLLM